MSDELRLAQKGIDELMEEYISGREPSLVPAYYTQLIRMLMVVQELHNAVGSLEATQDYTAEHVKAEKPYSWKYPSTD